MPKEARNADYYNSEYRFQLGDTVKVYKYSNTFDHNHKLEYQKDLVLESATSMTAAGIVSAVSMLAVALSF